MPNDWSGWREGGEWGRVGEGEGEREKGRRGEGRREMERERGKGGEGKSRRKRVRHGGRQMLREIGKKESLRAESVGERINFSWSTVYI